MPINQNTLLIKNYQERLRILQVKYNEDVKSLQQKIRDLQSGKIEEDGDVAISTASIGGTAFDSDGNVTKPAYGNNAAYTASYQGLTSRQGDYAKKKKRYRYNESTELTEYIDKKLSE